MKLPTVVVLLSTILTFQQLPALGSKKNSLGSNKKSQALLEKNGCLRCHFVKTEGGFIGPPLDGIRDHRSEEFITALLTGSLPEKQPE
ncbi:MAG: hypothetical protein K8F91_13550, partial [Candidatus Obscuribacterales bacterium]|nr:hypothetical protein [Candidatus Obscuribacterales bacterium]